MSTPLGVSTPGQAGYTPAQIRHAYGFDSIGFGSIVGTGAGQTIAIVDAYDNPSFVSSSNPSFVNSDLHKFDQILNIPDPPSFVKMNQTGGSTYPATNATWATEIALDVEWAHAMAPSANIILIEANSNLSTDLFAAVTYVSNLPGVSVVSMSFGSIEFAGETLNDITFTTPVGHQPITFLASTGDSGAPGGYPAYSPNVVAVGGTNLTLSGAAGNYFFESGWGGSGGGVSQFETKPAYQGSVYQSATKRTIPDVSMIGGTSVAVYDSFNSGSVTPWESVTGTSVSCPLFGGLIAIANQGRASFGQASLHGRNDALPRMYGYSPGIIPILEFHDITTGNNGFPAGPNYDLVTGLGTPYADRIVGELMDDTVAPSAGASPANVTLAGGTTYTLAVSFIDNVAVNPATMTDAIHIHGPNGFDVNATLNSVSVSPGSPRVAQYEFPAPGGYWTAAANGSYTVSINSYSAADYHLNPVLSGNIATFTVNIQQTFVVTNSNDSGAGSLRQALLDSNNGSDTTISFDFSFYLMPRFINLTSGALPINHAVLILGPGPSNLAINGFGASPIFNTFNAAPNLSMSIYGMTLFNGKGSNASAIAAGGSGPESLTLNNVVIASNTATSTFGAAVLVSSGGSLTAIDCSFLSNTGGAIETDSAGGKITLQRCTISGNSGISAVYVSGADLLIDGSTLSGNNASNSSGGAINSTGIITIRNSTIVGNTSSFSGGGIFINGNANELLVQNSTIVANTAAVGSTGGGIARSGTGAITIESTIVSGNQNNSGPDIASAGTVNVNFSAIGSNTGFTLTGSSNLPFGVNLLLGPLAANGGTTNTLLPASTSPLIDKGSNPAGLINDQRGLGYIRRLSGSADIGAVEAPQLVVTNANDSGTGSLRQALINANAQPTVDTITFDPTFFSVTRTITLTSGELLITDGVAIVGPGASLVTVNGNNSSRVFDLSAPGTGTVISISGLTISGGNTGAGGGIYNDGEALTVTNCIIAGNSATPSGGGGIYCEGGSVTIVNCSIIDNIGANGVGIFCHNANSITIRNSTISGNKSSNTGAGVYANTNVLIDASTISGNIAGGTGGGITFFSASQGLTLTVRNSTISGNSATQSGGGILAAFNGSVVLQNSTITGNSAGGVGGGVARVYSSNPITVESCIISGNTNTSAPDLFTTGTAFINFSGIGSKTGVTTWTADATTASLLGANFKLGGLANNGGPTFTHMPAPDSPLFNKGFNPAAQSTDQRGTGFPRSFGSGVDIGAIEVPLPSPRVVSVDINDGAAQRSRVTTLTVAFDSIVTLPVGAAETAFQLQRQSDGKLVSLSANLSAGPIGTTATLTFSGSNADSGSLQDGRYTLTIFANAVSNANGNLDGDGNDMAGGDYVLVGNMTNKLFRLFGDANGDGTVTAADFNAFRLAYGSTGPSIFDFNGDNQVTAADFNAFRTRYGITLVP